MFKNQRCITLKLVFLSFVLSVPYSVAENPVGRKMEIPVYKDKSAPIERRVEDLLSRMTLHEKVLQMENVDVHNTKDIDKVLKGESYGCVHEMQRSAADCAWIFKDVQKYTIEKTRLGIPIITVAEGIEGILQNGCTIFPQSLAMGSTFNTALMEQMTQAAGDEGRAIGIHQVLSPCLDIARELRWGRVEETYGEDPFLIAEMGIAFIKGYKKNNIYCTPKHFIAHGSPTGGLNCSNVSGGERELRSLYLYPFRRVITETNPMSLMNCYSSYDGIAIAGSSYYLTDILRSELGFKGYLYSDWGSIDQLKTYHHVAATSEDAAKLAVEAGVDFDVDSDYYLLEKMVDQGKVDIKYIDRAVRRILTVKFKLGLFENPYGDISKLKEVIHSNKNVELTRSIANESVILLKNENNILPLSVVNCKSIAIIGPNANQTVFGDYSWPGNEQQYGVNLLDGLKNLVGSKVTLNYAEGCYWWRQNKEGFDSTNHILLHSLKLLCRRM
jgi:beta-glucosidase